MGTGDYISITMCTFLHELSVCFSTPEGPQSQVSKGIKGQEPPWHSGSGVPASANLSLSFFPQSQPMPVPRPVSPVPNPPPIGESEQTQEGGGDPPHLVCPAASLSLAQGKGLLRQYVEPNLSLSLQTKLAWRNSRGGSWSPRGPLQAM